MLLSLKWLNDHVDLSGISPATIAAELTAKIALIEEVVEQAAALDGVVVGEVLARAAHPDADRLSVCRVRTGDAEHEVVCGAPNVAAGQKIAYAPVGITLPGGLTLEKRKIRGVLSHGMICSERELELGDDHDGILVLDPSVEVGAPLAVALELDDVLLEIDNKTVTHRADLWGHYGFARELAAIFDRPLRELEIDDELVAAPDAFPIELADREGCPLYLGLLIDGVSGNAPSPAWLARRLTAVGMRPLGLLVDLSNYVMLELGQPTHPFDRDTLEGGILVRRAQEEETLTTLDGQERGLRPDDVVIADRARTVALAGIMGGGDTEVRETTERVLLESAHFDAVRLRRTSSRLGLRTDALARFEKFLDPTLAELGVRRYARLLQGLAPQARIARGFAVAGEAKVEAVEIALRPDRVRVKLGLDLEIDEMERALRSIAFEVRREEGGEEMRLLVRPPSFRLGRDVQHEDDLIEEVGRLIGYDRIESRLPRVACDPPRPDRRRVVERESLLALVEECGYSETANYSFVSDRQVERYHCGDEAFLRLPHPLTQDTGRLRRSLVPGLLEQVSRNQVHRDEVRMVEVGRSYLREHTDGALPHERRELVAVRARRDGDAETLVFELRADADTLFRRIHVPFVAAPAEQSPRYAHPGRCIELVCGDHPAGWCAQLHPEIAQNFDLAGAVAVMWLYLDVVAAQSPIVPRMTPLPQFPSVRRDLSVMVEDSVAWSSLEEAISASSAGEHVDHLELFDVYRGKGVPEGCRSLAFRLEYRAPDRTLTDKEVESMQAAVIAALEARGARLRS